MVRLRSHSVTQRLSYFATPHNLSLAAVDVRQVVHLQHPHQFLDLLPALEDGGHDDHGGILVGDEAVLEFEFEGALRLVQFGEEPVEEVNGHLADGHR